MARNMWRTGAAIYEKGSGGTILKWWMDVTERTGERVTFRGNEAAKRCAEHLLAESRELAPQRAVGGIGKSYKNKGLGARHWANYIDTRTGKTQKLLVHSTSNPVDFGNLIRTSSLHPLYNSGQVDEVKGMRGDRRYKVSFDTRRTDDRSVENDFNYAIIQHERKDFKHTHGQAEYLRETYRKNRDMYKQWLAEGASEGIREAATRR